MKKLTNFVLFQLVWFLAVGGAADGQIWVGPLAAGALVTVHLWMIAPSAERRRELVYILVVGLVGTLADTALGYLDATCYPTSGAWPFVVVPPWITSLWVAFATLPRFSLGWLSGRTRLAVLFGAIGGPLSYLGGVRIGAVALGESPGLTLGALAAEYALVTPLLLHWAPGREATLRGRAGATTAELECASC